jgi:hypothetical protein
MLKIAVLIIFLVLMGGFVLVYTETTPLVVKTSSPGVMGVETTAGIFFDREVTQYPANLEVITRASDTVGISGDVNKIDFGILPQGGSSKKIVSIMNPRTSKVQARVYVNGLGMVKSDPEKVSINPGASANVSLTANVTDAVSLGNYSGTVDVLILIPKNDLISSML